MKRVGEKSYDLLFKKKKTAYEEDTEFINYLPQLPTLKNISIASIATSLWTKSDILKDIETNCKNQGYYLADLERLEAKCVKKLDELSYPTFLKVKISNYVRPIILELLKCCRKNGEYKKVYNLLKKGDFLQWTVDGTINKAKSLEALLNSNEKDRVSLEDLYHFACFYCLEDYIPEIISKLPERIYNLHRKDYNYHIEEYWNAVQTKQLPQLIQHLSFTDNNLIYNKDLNLYQNMVTMSVYTGNKSALRYFWPKLTDQEKNSCADKWMQYIVARSTLSSTWYQEYNEDIDIMFFLLSHFNDVDQRKKCFSRYPVFISKSAFLVWPYQRFFLPTMQKVMDYLIDIFYIGIVLDMFVEIKRMRITTDLLKELWQISPLKLKTKFIHNLKRNVTPIGDLISVGDSGTALMILKDASYPECKSLLFNVIDNILLLTDIISSNNLNFLNEVLTEILTTDYVIFLKNI